MKKANTILIFISLIIICLISCGDFFGTKSGSGSIGGGGGGGEQDKWDMDSDGDGYNDYTEESLGYDPYSADSYPPGGLNADGTIDFSKDPDVPTLEDIQNDPDKKDLWDIISEVGSTGASALSALGLANKGLKMIGVCVMPQGAGDTSELVQTELTGAPFEGTGSITFTGGAYTLVPSTGVGSSAGTYFATQGKLFLKPANFFGCIEIYDITTTRQCTPIFMLSCLPFSTGPSVNCTTGTIVDFAIPKCLGPQFKAKAPGIAGYITMINITGVNARNAMLSTGTYARPPALNCVCESGLEVDACCPTILPSDAVPKPIPVANHIK